MKSSLALTVSSKVSTTAQFPAGTQVYGDVGFGPGTFVYLKAGADIAKAGFAVVWDVAFTATAAPNTANLNRPVAFSTGKVLNNEYGWFFVGGRGLVQSTASVAVGSTVGIAAAGQMGTNSAGKQLVSGIVVQASSATLTGKGTVKSGSTTVVLDKIVPGLFVGQAVSGTGIAAGATIAAIDQNTKLLTLSAASTASGKSVSLTFTYNDGTTHFLLVDVAKAHLQGAIT